MVIRNPAQDPVCLQPFTEPKLMTIALGYSIGSFTPASPDRLCRGRERWITAPADRVGDELQRLVITAAHFEDDNSKNAKRGLSCANIDLFELLRVLFPNQDIVACAEDTSAQSIPLGAAGVEKFVMNRPFRPVQRWYARWEMDCRSSSDTIDAIAAGATVFLIGPSPKPSEETSVSYSDLPPLFESEDRPSRLGEAQRQALFYLAGGRTGPQSFGLYQPTALFDLLELSEAIVLLHRDKHAECLGIYVKTKETLEAMVDSLVSGMPNITVPFSIPPMLARWDRAIWELQSKWNEEEQGPFPLPAALAESGAPARSRQSSSSNAGTRPEQKQIESDLSPGSVQASEENPSPEPESKAQNSDSDPSAPQTSDPDSNDTLTSDSDSSDVQTSDSDSGDVQTSDSDPSDVQTSDSDPSDAASPT